MRMENDMSLPQACLDRRLSVCDRMIFGHQTSDYDPNYKWASSDDEIGPGDSPVTTQYSPVSYRGFSMEERDRQRGHSRYCLVASKQMVGVFLTIWVKSDIRSEVHNMKVSCVGRGLMGYLGNKVNFAKYLLGEEIILNQGVGNLILFGFPGFNIN